ncbi:MAG: cyclodeaminase/cyclohydrolase family protein [Candidatus Thermoplasmatota archaeon]|nr:cyclodeaminase/cyclohydrolase family protein [Candidatus Thermoplasmatota archaeon]
MDDYSRMTVKEFLTALSSSSPTPGGGSAAAISLANSAALTCMVCDLTLSKEKWKDGWEDAEKIQNLAIPLFHDSLELANKDAESFEKVMQSWKLPKNSEEEKKIRANEIEDATINAALIPLETAKKAANLLEVLPTLAEKGNSNAITDVAVAALLAHAASNGALLNVRINLLGLDKPEISKSVSEISNRIAKDLAKTLEIVDKKLN